MADITDPEYPYADTAAGNSVGDRGISDQTRAREIDDKMRQGWAATKQLSLTLFANDEALNEELATITADGWVVEQIADGSVEYAKLAIADGDIAFAKLTIEDGDIDWAKLGAIPAGSIARDALAANAKGETLLDSRILTAGDYDIPAGATRMVVEASGGGGGGSGANTNPSTNGGDTTVVGAGFNITAKGGTKGFSDTEHILVPHQDGSAGGDIILNAGAAGGRGHPAANGNSFEGLPGVVVRAFRSGNLAGTLEITYGNGGVGSPADLNGQPGYVKIEVYGVPQ